MKTYYQWLEIEETASEIEIKKAYFKMVRKYPPDKEEEKFKSIREGYELLSNPQTRKEYDQVILLPEDVREIYSRGNEFVNVGDFVNAIRHFEYLVERCPDIDFLKAFLAHAYALNGNTGKAIKILEDLVSRYPEIPGYKTKLGVVYIERGWYKKALGYLEEAIVQDEDNVGAWIGLGMLYRKTNRFEACVRLMERALQKEELKSLENLFYHESICSYLGMEAKGDKVVSYEQQIIGLIHKVKAIGIKEEDESEPLGMMLMNVMQEMMRYKCFAGFDEIILAIEVLIKDHEEVQQMISLLKKGGKEVLLIQMMCGRGEISEEILELLKLALLESHMTGEELQECEMMREMIELRIAENYREHKEEIVFLEQDYPSLYGVKERFFNMLKDTKQRRKFIRGATERAMKMMSKMLMESATMDCEEDEWEMPKELGMSKPFQGRNEPCLCGSGKKYKRCCGK